MFLCLKKSYVFLSKHKESPKDRAFIPSGMNRVVKIEETAARFNNRKPHNYLWGRWRKHKKSTLKTFYNKNTKP